MSKIENDAAAFIKQITIDFSPQKRLNPTLIGFAFDHDLIDFPGELRDADLVLTTCDQTTIADICVPCKKTARTEYSGMKRRQNYNFAESRTDDHNLTMGQRG
mgnify:CR=1 FL=1